VSFWPGNWNSRPGAGIAEFILQAYIINLDRATDRWKFVSGCFDQTGIPYTRVSGIVGRELTLPHPQYSSLGFKLRHGHKTNFGAIGCYLSHLKALQLFLDSNHRYAIIAEDDASPVSNLTEILESAIQHQSTWDILRLCGFHDPHAHEYVHLIGEYHLAVCMTRLCGTACYVVTRHAAEVLLKCLDPMCLPYDHALDREWAFGLRAAAVVPLPVSQRAHEFLTQCGEKPDHKLPWFVRYWTVFPYRAWNETNRFFRRRQQLAQVKRLLG
jgi:glycosyl transferase, family 25